MIKLEPYKNEWVEDFQREQQDLLKKLNAYNVVIEHIGSTAIKGIYAKPIIDIMLGVVSLAMADKFLISLIESLSYKYIPSYEEVMPERRFFYKPREAQDRTHQIHLVEYKSEFWNRHILFRDYLRAHLDVAKEYEQLKLELAKKFIDSNEYAAAKSSFIRKIEQRAK